jgi:hypothetical protein
MDPWASTPVVNIRENRMIIAMRNALADLETAMIFLFKMFEIRIKLTKKSEGKFECTDMSPHANRAFRV